MTWTSEELERSREQKSWRSHRHRPVLLRALEDARSVGDEEHEAAMLIAALDLGSFVERRLLAGEN